MSWEHQMARELKARNNVKSAAWTLGTVLSPSKSVGEDGMATYHGSISVSCYGGEIILGPDRLMQIAQINGGPYYKGQSVAILGDPTTGGPGSQMLLILGVVSRVV